MARRGTIDWPLLVPLLVVATLLQTTVPLVRVATSYRAVAMDLSLASIGLLSGAFALLPVFLTVRVGRYSDRRGEAGVALVGALLVLVAVTGLWLAPAYFYVMLAFTLLLGVGQVMTISALQVATTRCSDAEAQDRVLGNFLIATALGHTIGPLILTAATPAGAVSPGPALFPILAAAAALMTLGATLMALRLPPHTTPLQGGKPTSLRDILATPGMLPTVIASGVCLATNDLIIVFLPALATDRGIDAGTVGLLLSVRAGSSMASRLAYSRLVRTFGRINLMTIALLASGVASLALFLSLPIWALVLVLAAAGYAMGMAIACTISVTIALSDPGSRATALSLRMTANRLGQFLLPMGAGATAAGLGAGSPFVVTGLALLACGVMVRAAKP